MGRRSVAKLLLEVGVACLRRGGGVGGRCGGAGLQSCWESDVVDRIVETGRSGGTASQREGVDAA